MELMANAVEAGTFRLDKATSDRIHGVVARHEAIESGHFRGEGSIQDGGNVLLASGGSIDGDAHGVDCKHLMTDYANLIASLRSLVDPRARALAYFASATRSQFYFDGNKRTARIIMTDALMQAGYEPLNFPYARQEEFNVALDEVFRTNDETTMIECLTTCTILDMT